MNHALQKYVFNLHYDLIVYKATKKCKRLQPNLSPS